MVSNAPINNKKIQFLMISFTYTNINYIYSDKKFCRSVGSGRVLVRLKKRCRLSLDDYWAGCRHLQWQAAAQGRGCLPAQWPRGRTPREAAVMQGKEKGSPLVNLSLTIVMSCACYSPLASFISFSSFHSYLYWCLPLEFCSMRSMGVDVRRHSNLVKMCLSIFGGPKKQTADIISHVGSSVG